MRNTNIAHTSLTYSFLRIAAEDVALKDDASRVVAMATREGEARVHITVGRTTCTKRDLVNAIGSNLTATGRIKQAKTQRKLRLAKIVKDRRY